MVQIDFQDSRDCKVLDQLEDDRTLGSVKMPVLL